MTVNANICHYHKAGFIQILHPFSSTSCASIPAFLKIRQHATFQHYPQTPMAHKSAFLHKRISNSKKIFNYQVMTETFFFTSVKVKDIRKMRSGEISQPILTLFIAPSNRAGSSLRVLIGVTPSTCLICGDSAMSHGV